MAVFATCKATGEDQDNAGNKFFMKKKIHNVSRSIGSEAGEAPKITMRKKFERQSVIGTGLYEAYLLSVHVCTVLQETPMHIIAF
jgi:hypothetical protein